MSGNEEGGTQSDLGGWGWGWGCEVRVALQREKKEVFVLRTLLMTYDLSNVDSYEK